MYTYIINKNELIKALRLYWGDLRTAETPPNLDYLYFRINGTWYFDKKLRKDIIKRCLSTYETKYWYDKSIARLLKQSYTIEESHCKLIEEYVETINKWNDHD